MKLKIPFGLILLLFFACKVPQSNNMPCNPNKITFDLETLDENGLKGGPQSKVALDYEFCIPKTEKAKAQILKIDSTIQIHSGSKGRIGCTKEEHLCIGNTHKKDYKTILCQLSMLDFVKRIDQTFWE